MRKKKLLAVALAGLMAVSVISVPNINGTVAYAEDVSGDFVIKDGVLAQYNGTDGEVVIPKGVTNIGYYAKEDNYFGTSYYEVFDLKQKSWDVAKEYCESLGGHLATITSATENEFIHDFILKRGYKDAYFGLYYDDDGEWKWVTGEPVSYLNWHKGEPSSVHEKYGMFYDRWSGFNGDWNDGDFGVSTVYNETAFICEWDMEDVSVDLFAFYDVDNDGKITLNDTKKILKYALGIKESTTKYNLTSAKMCLRIALGIISLDK